MGEQFFQKDTPWDIIKYFLDFRQNLLNIIIVQGKIIDLHFSDFHKRILMCLSSQKRLPQNGQELQHIE